MHDEQAWHRGWQQGWRGRPGERPGDADVAGEGFAYRHGGPGGPGGPRPGGRGPFRARVRDVGDWRGGPGWPPFPGFMFADPRRHRGPRAKRGDVRAAALALLAEEPRNGYQIIQEIESRSGGVWRPSPGSVYPALQQLEDEGLIHAVEADGGRRAFELTPAGHTFAEQNADELAAPWDAVAGAVGDDIIDMRQLVGQVAMAAMQVLHVGTDAQAGAARQILAQARRSLYRILANDEEPDDATPGTTAEDAQGKT